jgi:hypothetical protein
MKVFETDGRFWLPTAPEEALAGRLQWEKDGGSELVIRGSFKGERNDLGDRYPVILGVVEKTPTSLGSPVTLWNSYLTSRTISSIGLTRERYHAQVLLSGQHLGDENDVTFKSAKLRFSSLDEWAVRFTGLETTDRMQGEKLTFGFRQTNPEVLVIPCGGSTLTLYTKSVSKQKRRHYELEESVILGVQPEQPLRLAEMNDRFVYPLQNFLTFAMNSPASVERWVNHLPGDDEGSPDMREVDISYRRHLSGPESAEDSRTFRPLFDLEHIRGRLPHVFDAWLNASVRLRDTFNLYFGVQYIRQLFTDWRFQTILHALTLYGRVGGPRPTRDLRLRAILESIEPENAAYITKLLDTSLLLGSEIVLSELMVEHGSEIEWLFGRPSTAFVERVTNTLHYFMHREVANVFAASRGTELYDLTEILGWLMKLCLMKEIGFSKDERRQLMERQQVAQRIHVASRQAAQV